jgi:hypothetical protein
MVYRRAMPGVGSSAFSCEECKRGAEGAARGWMAYLCDLDDDGEDEVVFYCPACAAREFADGN